MNGLFEVYNKKTNELKLDQTNHVLVACIKSQIIRLFNNGRRVKDYKNVKFEESSILFRGFIGNSMGIASDNRNNWGRRTDRHGFWGECRSDKILNAQLKTQRIWLHSNFKTGRIGTWTQSRRYSRYLRSLCLHSRNESWGESGHPVRMFASFNFNAVELSKEIPVNTHLLILSESPWDLEPRSKVVKFRLS